MLTFKYVARDGGTGQKITSELQAENEQAATKLIMAQGLTPLEVTLEDSSKGIGKYFNRVSSKDRILFARQLSTLINAGLPLLQSLRTVGGQTRSKKLKVILNEIIADVEGGSPLNEALARHPETFNQVFISLIAAGETSGTLDDSLARIAVQQEKDAEILRKVRGAMVYPFIVILVMIGVLGFMIVAVLPQVKVLYEGLGTGAQLPLITRVLLAISEFVIHFWWAILVALAALAFGTSKWARTLGGKRVIDKIKMKAWPAASLFMKMYMARFARTAQTLIASGVPLLQVLDITARSINNVHIEDSIRVATAKVKGGKSLSDSIKGDSNFLPLVPDMLHIGEESGAVESMMGKVADYYENEVDQQIKTISTVIEPVLMVMLGIVALIIVAAVLLPIYSLAGKDLSV